MEQLELELRPRGRSRTPEPGQGGDPSAFGRWLSQRVGKPVRVTFTDNRSTMLSCRQRGEVLHLRLQRFFASADNAELEALGAYLRGDRRADLTPLDRFIAQQVERLPPPDRIIKTKGRFHNLGEILEEVNQTFFHNASQARITWGSAGRRRNRRTIQLGCYVSQENLIRIHPCLDQAFVPRQYVAWVIFHEMLHEVLGVALAGERRSVHPPEFSVLEETFPGYRRCKEWERRNLERLLRYRPPRKRRR